jgi:hypothetical protein
VQMEVLLQSIDLWRADRLGFSDLAAWQNMLDVLTDMGSIPSSISVEEAFTNQFID